MIDPTHQTLSVTRQCGLLGLSRSTLYYKPVNDNSEDLAIKALERIDVHVNRVIPVRSEM